MKAGNIILWLCRSRYRRCSYCGQAKLKRGMIDDPPFHWFCNKECGTQFWKDSQW
jgi:hypothetical protein